MTTVRIEVLENLYDRFVKLIQERDNSDLISFEKCKFFNEYEAEYKKEIYKDAREIIKNARWKPEDVGTGIIHKTISDAVSLNKNNLVNYFGKKLDFKNLKPTKQYEQLLFDFYKSKGIKDEHVFDELLKIHKLSYNLIAYLFFIKDRNQFLPISQKQFDGIFKDMNLNFKTDNSASWDNYLTFIDIINQVKVFLKGKGKKPTLLDAHSFLWFFSDEMKEHFAKKPILKEVVEIKNTQNNSITSSIIEETKVVPKVIEDFEPISIEGESKLAKHMRYERNSNFIKQIKDIAITANPMLNCEVCKFSFYEKYGDLGQGFIEAHHKIPLHLTKETITTKEDIALLCSNCHRMIHRGIFQSDSDSIMTIDELKKLIND
jgi:predicted HNH restriction endonuclease